MSLKNICSKSNKNIYRMLLIFIILLSVIRISYTFFCVKENYHSDEIWSFGLSNSYYEPFIYQSDDHTELTNKDQWFSSEVFRNYLTVQPDQRFNYGSVYYNQVYDYHPPLYYFILHTLCSFFPDKLYFELGFLINIVSYIFTQIFLYKLIKSVTRDDITALGGCILYGFSIGTLNTFVFVRMYSMQVMFAAIFMYLHAQLHYTEKFKKYIIYIFAVTILGAYTHHFFLIFAASVAACFCFYYLIKKFYKKMIVYAVTMLLAAGTSVLIFPATIDHLFSGRTGDIKYTPDWQIKMSVNVVLQELFGVNIPIVAEVSPLAVLIIIVCCIVIISPVIFLVRKELWFKKFCNSIKNIFSMIGSKLKKSDPVIIAMFFSVLSIVVTTAVTVSFIAMGTLSDRYIFFVYPSACAFFTCLLYHIMKLNKFLSKYNKYITIVICIVFCVLSNHKMRCGYLFQKPDDVTLISDVIKDKNCVVISDEHWLLTCLSKEAMDADNIYATTQEDILEKVINLPEEPTPDKPLIYFVAKHAFKPEEKVTEVLEAQMPGRGVGKDFSDYIEREQFEEQLIDKYGECNYVGYDTLFDREFYIYQVK